MHARRSRASSSRRTCPRAASLSIAAVTDPLVNSTFAPSCLADSGPRCSRASSTPKSLCTMPNRAMLRCACASTARAAFQSTTHRWMPLKSSVFPGFPVFVILLDIKMLDIKKRFGRTETCFGEQKKAPWPEGPGWRGRPNNDLKGVSGGELQLPRARNQPAEARVVDRTRIAALQPSVRIAKRRMVEHIEGIQPHLDRRLVYRDGE